MMSRLGRVAGLAEEVAAGGGALKCRDEDLEEKKSTSQRGWTTGKFITHDSNDLKPPKFLCFVKQLDPFAGAL